MIRTLRWLAIALLPLILAGAIDIGMHGEKSLTYTLIEFAPVMALCPRHNWLSTSC